MPLDLYVTQDMVRFGIFKKNPAFYLLILEDNKEFSIFF